MTINNRLSYNKGHCWQYDIRLSNLEQDLKEAGLTKEQAEALSVSDFTFRFIDKTDKEMCDKIKAFIERHEWLGKLSLYPTHRFVAEYNGILAGVVIMDQPNAFSKLLGEETKKLERLISRGACVSWSPKGLASALIMFSIRWMVKNTRYRLFTAYSDVEAKELGTIYQACNFIYLGKSAGTKVMYMDPNKPEKGWFSDRSFRSRSAYKRYAKELGIEWKREWQGARTRTLKDWETTEVEERGGSETILWENMPEDVRNKLRQAAKDYQSRCIKREVPSKHKYCYILGATKKETKELKERFKALNPDKVNLPYPKNRGE
jgi:hypothetical protein